MPDKGVNGFEQALAAIQVLPAQPWPQPSFPQFDNDRDYQRRIVAAMRKSLNERDRMSAFLLNKEEARVFAGRARAGAGEPRPGSKNG